LDGCYLVAEHKAPVNTITVVSLKQPDDMQLPYLETFSKAAELNSFTGAAKALRLTQAAVSQRIQALERALDTPLFERHGGRVLPTTAGQKLYSYAQRILDLHRQARREVVGHATPLTGELFLAASSIPGEHLLPALLSDFHKKYPHIKIHASVSDSMAVLAQIESGDVSIGLVGRKVDNRNLVFRYLASDRMMLVVPPHHPLRKRKNVTVRDMLRYPLILREAGSGIRHFFEKALESAHYSTNDVNVAVELGSNEAIKEAVLHGDGVAILSTLAIQKENNAGRLHGLAIKDLDCEREMFVVQDTRRVLPLPARLFLDFLEAQPVVRVGA
jgi:DNA-binding transcriptional LysR family regulator